MNDNASTHAMSTSIQSKIETLKLKIRNSRTPYDISLRECKELIPSDIDAREKRRIAKELSTIFSGVQPRIDYRLSRQAVLYLRRVGLVGPNTKWHYDETLAIDTKGHLISK